MAQFQKFQSTVTSWLQGRRIVKEDSCSPHCKQEAGQQEGADREEQEIPGVLLTNNAHILIAYSAVNSLWINPVINLLSS